MEISIDIVALSSIPDDTVLNLKESFIRVNDSTLAIAAKMDKTPIKKTLPISIVGNMGVIPEVRQSLYFSTIEDNKITAVLDFKNPRIVSIEPKGIQDILVKTCMVDPTSIVVAEVRQLNYDISSQNKVLENGIIKDLPVSDYTKQSYVDGLKSVNKYTFNTEKAKSFMQF